MELYVFEGKDENIIKEKAYESLSLTEQDLLFKKEKIKGGLFKSEVFKYSFVKIVDVQKFLVDYLNDLISQMNIKANVESNIREKQINIKIYSDNNPILIGKNGKTITALTTLSKQAIFNYIGIYPYLNIDVENYKEKQMFYIERLAKNIAKEVKQTGIAVEMENMNAYERRIVHNALSKFTGITTESEGEEPNRHIVVKSKKD